MSILLLNIFNVKWDFLSFGQGIAQTAGTSKLSKTASNGIPKGVSMEKYINFYEFLGF
jgi:hypothetical protein